MPDLFRRRPTAGRPWRPALDRLLRRLERGQALVEFALITPLLLVLLLGTAMIGITSAERIRLEHAASEATVAGALETDPAARCVAAERAAAAVLGRGVEMTCSAQPDVIEVRLSHQLPLLVPFVGDHVDIDVSQRSMVRTQPATDEDASDT